MPRKIEITTLSTAAGDEDMCNDGARARASTPSATARTSTT